MSLYNKSRNLRILVLARVFPPRKGGIENFMYNIYSRLAFNHNITVVTPNWPGSKSFDAKQNFKVIRTPQLPFIGERHGAPLFGMLLFALKEILFYRPDQIHCDQIDTAIVGRLLAAIFRIPYLIYAYAMEVTNNHNVQLKRWVAEEAKAIIAISQYTRVQVEKYWGFRLARIYLIHPGTDVNRFYPQVNPTKIRAKCGLDGKKIILTVGRLAAPERYKGHDYIIAGMPRILHEVPEAVYLVVGDGTDRGRLETLTRNYNIDGQVIFTGEVSEEELPEFYAASDVFVMPSREGKNNKGGTLTEGFGIVFLEANASMKPVIGGRIGGVLDAVIDGVTGLLVDPNDIDEIAKAIIKLLTNEALALKLGRQGRERVVNELTWDKVVDKLREVITVEMNR